MKRLFTVSMLMGILMFLALMWGLYTCQEARADHWTQIATLLPGTYMLVGTDLEQSAQIQAVYQGLLSGGSDPADTTMNFVHRGPMLVFVVTPGSWNASHLADFFEIEPQTAPDDKSYLFRKTDIGRWIQVDLPCKWVEGIEM